MRSRTHNWLSRPAMLMAMLATSIACMAYSANAQTTPTGFVVIVHESIPLDAISMDRLSRIFLRKLDHWEDGVAITAVNQAADSRLFRTFATKVHRRSSTAVVSYWQQQIFSGRRIPPPERKDDRAVLAFVRSTPGAIGYISNGTAPGEGVRIVRITP